MHNAAKRDALTGTPIRPDAIQVPWEIAAHRLPREHYSDPGNMIVGPLRLHTRRETAVGPAYSNLLLRYLAAGEWEARDDIRQEEIRADKCWWESAYGLQLVRKRLLEYHGLDTALRILEAVTTMHEEQLTFEEAADRAKRSLTWMRDQYFKCNRLANAHRRVCKCDDCETWRASHQRAS